MVVWLDVCRCTAVCVQAAVTFVAAAAEDYIVCFFPCWLRLPPRFKESCPHLVLVCGLLVCFLFVFVAVILFWVEGETCDCRACRRLARDCFVSFWLCLALDRLFQLIHSPSPSVLVLCQLYQLAPFCVFYVH